MFAWIGWIVAGLAILWGWSSLRLSHRKRLNMRSYVIYLLLSNRIRQHHRINFWSWIQDAELPDQMALGRRAQDVVEDMAEQLADEGSLLTSTAMVWKVKMGELEE